MFSMQGTLVDTSPTELWLRLSSQVATGTLTITGPRGDGRVRFAHGDVAEAHASGGTSQAIRLGERLVHAGRLDRPDLEAVLAGQASASVATPLGSLLVERGLVSADIVRVFLQEQALEAMTTIVGWTQGRYSFEVGPAAGPRVHLSLPVRRALMELQRRSRERELIRVHVPGPSSVPLPQEDQAQPPRLTADAFTILTAVDGLRTVGAIAASLGYSYEEASRVIYRLVLQGLVTIAETHSSALLAIQDDTVQTSSTTPPTTPLDDQGWFERRDAVRAEEPEPWVGFANATPPPPATPASEPAPQAPAAAASATAEPATSAPASDEDLRQALFAELHQVGRPAEPARPVQATPAPAPEPEPEPEPQPAAPPAVTPPAAAPLSSAEVSDLLQELHALNRDEPPSSDGR
jgi:hypothetical protein